MRRFVSLLDSLRSEGVSSIEGDGPTQKVIQRELTASFWKHIENCQPFVFSDTGPFIDDKQVDHRNGKGYDDETLLDAPFQYFTIEVAGDGPLAVYPFPDLGLPKGYGSYVYCILVSEIRPGQFIYYTQMKVVNEYGTHWLVVPSNADGPAVAYYLARLAREQTGMETARAKVKLGTGKAKRFHRMSQVIHVKPKGDHTPSTGTREVDWSHRFSVRGHWRKTDGIGKDRAGQYCVQGFTWVSEHIRGPEHLPYIRKTRLIEDQPKIKSDEPLKLLVVKTDE